MPNGLIIQWGNGFVPALSKEVSVTFPITFPNSAFCVLITDVADTSSYSPFAVGWPTRIGFELFGTTEIQKNNGFFWLTIGY